MRRNLDNIPLRVWPGCLDRCRDSLIKRGGGGEGGSGLVCDYLQPTVIRNVV